MGGIHGDLTLKNLISMIPRPQEQECLDFRGECEVVKMIRWPDQKKCLDGLQWARAVGPRV